MRIHSSIKIVLFTCLTVFPIFSKTQDSQVSNELIEIKKQCISLSTQMLSTASKQNNIKDLDQFKKKILPYIQGSATMKDAYSIMTEMVDLQVLLESANCPVDRSNIKSLLKKRVEVTIKLFESYAIEFPTNSPVAPDKFPESDFGKATITLVNANVLLNRLLQ